MHLLYALVQRIEYDQPNVVHFMDYRKFLFT